jgi:SAM-dependent methyltransferase
MLGKVLRDLIRPGKSHPAPESGQRRVLNVGGGNKAIPIPRHYNGWEHLLLDSLPAGQFDAVYCSHNLEHYYRHDGASVLRGFLHVLKADGFAEIRVPDIQAVMRHVVQSGMDIGDVLYESAVGPITVRDVVYGYSKEIEQSGKDFYAHKTGFTAKSLHRALESAGFAAIFVLEAPEAFEAKAFAFKSEATTEQRRLLDLAPIAVVDR